MSKWRFLEKENHEGLLILHGLIFPKNAIGIFNANRSSSCFTVIIIRHVWFSEIRSHMLGLGLG